MNEFEIFLIQYPLLMEQNIEVVISMLGAN